MMESLARMRKIFGDQWPCGYTVVEAGDDAYEVTCDACGAAWKFDDSRKDWPVAVSSVLVKHGSTHVGQANA